VFSTDDFRASHSLNLGYARLSGLLPINALGACDPDRGHSSVYAKSLIWSDPVNVCESVGPFLSFRFRLMFFEDRGSSSLGRFERRLISLIFAGRNRIILIRRELPLTSVASPAKPVA